jgi:hypothetical protein
LRVDVPSRARPKRRVLCSSLACWSAGHPTLTSPPSSNPSSYSLVSIPSCELSGDRRFQLVFTRFVRAIPFLCKTPVRHPRKTKTPVAAQQFIVEVSWSTSWAIERGFPLLLPSVVLEPTSTRVVSYPSKDGSTVYIPTAFRSNHYHDGLRRRIQGRDAAVSIAVNSGRL